MSNDEVFSCFVIGHWCFVILGEYLRMRWREVRAPDFDLAKTLNSGQVFHWEKVGEGFYGTIGDRAVYVEQRDATLRANVASASSRCSNKHGQDAHATIRHYFALDHPLDEICASFPRDPVMNAAHEFCHGLRIIRQPNWECLATFICSSMKQVTHIRQISRALRQRYGVKKEICGEKVFSFPSADRLAATSENDLRKCGLGYRAATLLATAKHVASGEVNLSSWNELSDGELCAQLCQLPGVGAKIANCVMLFAYERVKAFPIDVWIERVLRGRYFARKRRVTRLDMAEFATNYFGPYGGYAQQYLFHHARMTKKRRRKG
jgi:N-glycosylase/DNA lyase